MVRSGRQYVDLASQAQYRLGYLLDSGAQLAKLAIDMMPASLERLDWPEQTWSRIDPLLDG